MSATEIAYSHILCPVDFSQTASVAFRQALGYARLFDARLSVLHVCERNWAVDGFDDQDDRAETERRLELEVQRRLEELLVAQDVSAEDRARLSLVIESGRPWEAIVEHARRHDVDLIVIGTHGHTGLMHMVIGSQAERVVRVAPCPVLTMRPDAAAG